MGILFYWIFYYMTYYHYSKGSKVCEAIKGPYLILFNNANVRLPSLRNFNMSFVSYEFDKANVILTEYSIILIGDRFKFRRNIEYLPPIEIQFNEQYSEKSKHRAKIIDYSINPDRIILHVKDQHFPQVIKVNIKSEVEVIENWVRSNNLLPKTRKL